MAGLDASTDEGASVQQSLADFVIAYDELQSDFHNLTSSLQAVSLASVSKAKKWMKVLVNMGQPVLIERIGKGKTIKECTNKEVKFISKDAIAVDASTIDLEGCLVYHKLSAITDYNNPKFTPDTLPASFRAICFESGCISALEEADSMSRNYTLSTVHDFLFTKLGHTVTAEDDEGVVTNESLTENDLSDFYTTFLQRLQRENLTLTDLKGYRYHTGYNPAGGWEVNMAATLQDETPANCNDSDPDTSCSLTPLKYNFDGTTLTQSDSGPYGLEMEFRNGGFQDFAWVINLSTSKPYRDTNFQRVQVTITASDYTAIDFANPFHASTLDPMCNSDETSCVPFANVFWRAAHPTKTTLVNNAYLFATPEEAVRQVLVLKDISALSRMGPLEAFTLYSMTQGSMASFPDTAGTHMVFADHGQTLSQWDTLATAWLESGTPSLDWKGDGNMSLSEEGTFTVTKKKCTVKPKGGSKEDCTLSVNSLSLDKNSATSTDNGTQYTLSGNLTVQSNTYSATLTPTHALVSSNQKKFTLIGQSGFSFKVSGKKMKDKIDAGTALTGKYSFQVDTD